MMDDDTVAAEAAKLLRQLADDVEGGRISLKTAGYGGRLTEWGDTEQFFEMTWHEPVAGLKAAE